MLTNASRTNVQENLNSNVSIPHGMLYACVHYPEISGEIVLIGLIIIPFISIIVACIFENINNDEVVTHDQYTDREKI